MLLYTYVKLRNILKIHIKKSIEISITTSKPSRVTTQGTLANTNSLYATNNKKRQTRHNVLLFLFLHSNSKCWHRRDSRTCNRLALRTRSFVPWVDVSRESQLRNAVPLLATIVGVVRLD